MTIDDYIASDPLMRAAAEIFNCFITGEIPEHMTHCQFCGQLNEECVCQPEICEECYWFINYGRIGLCTCEASRCYNEDRISDAEACSKAIFHWEGQLQETGRIDG